MIATPSGHNLFIYLSIYLFLKLLYTHGDNKKAKYTSLTNSYIFQPIAVESHGAFSASVSVCIFFNSVLPHHFGRTLDWYILRLAPDVISIPKTIGHCTAFQFGPKTRELCFCR